MTSERSHNPRTHSTKLERLLNELTIALIEHSKYLDKHINAVETLTQTMKQLDSTIRKDLKLGTSQPSLELKEAINSFLEYNINPKFYQDSNFLKLPIAYNNGHIGQIKKIRAPKQQ